MLTAFLNIFRVADLRNRVLFTLGMLAIYRIGFWIPLVGVDQVALSEAAQQANDDASGFGRILQFASVFSGGALGQSTVFGLGIMPYITASIIFQLLQSVWQPLQDLKKEGMSGQQKIQEWTRYATIGLCIVQGMMWLGYMYSQNLVQPSYMAGTGRMVFYVSGLTALTAGSLFLMWLGEQIDKHGIGNGVSLILTAGILARMPAAVEWVVANFNPSIQSGDGKVGVVGVALLVLGFCVVVGGAVLITVAQRRIPIQQAKHVRGRKVYGGQRHHLPLRLNHSGVMPIIFASSLMVFPSTIFGWLSGKAALEGWSEWLVQATAFLALNFQMGSYPYIVVEIVLIYFFAYFWVTVQLSPDDMAKELRKHSSFIPGLRPGPRTAEYLETVIGRMTYVGGGFLCIIAIIPSFVSQFFGVPPYVSQFLGGTGLLIVVSVMLDLVQRIEANLLMRNYAGFLSTTGEDGPRLRSARG
ncbi:MAG: preprotein translocase subunit SecY [Planctomycetota bacterium]|nr:preprotein translocase subunit SecY [Planctomycetota bacterium]MDA1105265.1 preprotein translocase subunit SecY [Planctomycetota bacterium]